MTVTAPTMAPVSSMIPAPSLMGPVTQALTVVTPSGQNIQVLGVSEESFYRIQAAKYQAENLFTNTSDLLDLDRLLFLELTLFRMSQWLGAGIDYDGAAVDRRECQRTYKETSELIGKVKADLGLTKSARDKAIAEDNGAYLTKLKQRAHEWGIHRETQLRKALILTNQLISIVGAYDRSDSVERGKLGFETEHEILQWVREVYTPQYLEVDRHFRQRADGQKYWVRDL